MKKPLYENKTGFINLGGRATYYYTYPNLKVEGFANGEKVSGKAWFDKQWDSKGFMKDFWVWFSIQIDDNTEIICCDYKGKKFATISYPNNKQDSPIPKLIPMGNKWKSKKSGETYNLNWKIKIKNITIETEPIIKSCEMNFGSIHYWEGPIKLKVKIGKTSHKAQGFMEYVAQPRKFTIEDFLRKFVGK